MLKPPRIGGAAQLRLFVDELGFARACRIVDVHENTMWRWLREETPVPQAAIQALYWLTSWGFSDAASEAHWTHQHMLAKVRELQTAIDWKASAHWQAVNESEYHAPGLVVPLKA